MSVTSSARRFAPLAVVAALTFALSGCSGADNGDGTKDDACTDYKSGSVSDSVKVSGTFGEQGVSAEFDSPLAPKELERTIVTEGDGDVTKAGQTVNTHITLINGASGESLYSQPASLPVSDPSVLAEFSAGIECVPLGSRVVVTVPGDQMYGGQGNPQLGLGAGESVIIVTDLIDLFVVPPLPSTQDWTENKATVKFNGEEPPELTLPKTDPSPELLLEVLEEGTGDVLEQGGTFTANYQGTKWSDGEIFDQSFGKGSPLTLKTDQVVKGFAAAMVGQKVGAKLVVSIPPQYGYGESPDEHALGGETLVFVIDLLGAEPAA